MKAYFQYLLFLFMFSTCQQNVNSFSCNKSANIFDPNKPCWCPKPIAKIKRKLIEANSCQNRRVLQPNLSPAKIDQYVIFNDLSKEEEQDFIDRSRRGELTIEELEILDGIIIDKQQPRSDEGPVCRKRGCPYYKCYRKKNCTCC